MPVGIMAPPAAITNYKTYGIMKTITIEKNVYEYSELNEQAQDECDCNQYTFFEDGKVCHSVSSIAV